MRCAEVTRELAAPTTGAEPADLAQHLASCAGCATYAEAARRLDRVWAATRPALPPADRWETLWANVAMADAATIPFPHRSPRRRWVAPVVTFALISQAAALLVAFGMLLRRDATGSSSAPEAINVVQEFDFVLKADQTLFLKLDEEGGRVVCEPEFISTSSLANLDSEGPSPTEMAQLVDLDLANFFESMP
jgi:hypothetical protein